MEALFNDCLSGGFFAVSLCGGLKSVGYLYHRQSIRVNIENTILLKTSWFVGYSEIIVIR